MNLINPVTKKVAHFVLITSLVFSFDALAIYVIHKMGYRVTIHIYKNVEPGRANTTAERNGFTLRLY